MGHSAQGSSEAVEQRTPPSAAARHPTVCARARHRRGLRTTQWLMAVGWPTVLFAYMMRSPTRLQSRQRLPSPATLRRKRAACAGHQEEMLEEEVMEEEPRVKSMVTDGGRSQKGRGFKDGAEPERHPGGKFESLEAGTGPGPAKCAPRRTWFTTRARAVHPLGLGRTSRLPPALQAAAAPHSLAPSEGAICCGR